jgi:hypothetical protein
MVRELSFNHNTLFSFFMPLNCKLKWVGNLHRNAVFFSIDRKGLNKNEELTIKIINIFSQRESVSIVSSQKEG